MQHRLTALSIVLVFLCCAPAHATLVFAEPFSYPDGSLTTVSGGTWVNHSGTAGQMDVASGVVNVTQAEGEDTNRPFVSAATTLYAGLTFSFSALPTGGTGNYFFHFFSTSSIFRGRVFATTTGAAAGTLRIGISNASNAPTFEIVPTDISLGTTHRLVLKLDSSGVNAASTLYLDSATETGGTAATDVATSVSITAVALRQSTATGLGMGVLTADDLQVATTYGEAFTVIPEPSAILFGTLVCGVIGLGVGGRRLKNKLLARD